MSQMHVPPVTLEDLQAFQAKHFPTTIKPLVQPPPSQTQGRTYEETHDVDVVEDLGYYPDGLKRTLTDEQIRIFRHSEIHALLRERQIRAENEEYDRKFGDKAQTGAELEQSQGNLKKTDEVASVSSDQNAGDKATHDTKTVAGTKRSSDEAGSASSEQVAKKQSTSTSTVFADVHLDYNEGQDSVARRPSRGQAASQFVGRRIISYDD
ncbi:hypothetical protein BJX76DRAFT_356832 [Aspergillus varians]